MSDLVRFNNGVEDRIMTRKVFMDMELFPGQDVTMRDFYELIGARLDPATGEIIQEHN